MCQFFCIESLHESNGRVCEIQWPRQTCLTKISNVRRRCKLSKMLKMASFLSDIKCPAKYRNVRRGTHGLPDILSGKAQNDFAYSAMTKPQTCRFFETCTNVTIYDWEINWDWERNQEHSLIITDGMTAACGNIDVWIYRVDEVEDTQLGHL